MPEVGEGPSQIVSGSAEGGVLGVSEHTLQPVPSQLAVRLLVADLGLNS